MPAILGPAELNIEGNPFAPAREGYPGLLALVRATHPAQVTLVPDSRCATDLGSWIRPDRGSVRICASVVGEFRREGCRVSVFVDAGCSDLARLAECGVDRVEIYTGPFAAAAERGDVSAALADCLVTAREARSVGLGVNAGHDLSQANLAALLTAIPWIDEVSIGHALFAEALYEGLGTTVSRYLAILAAVRG